MAFKQWFIALVCFAVGGFLVYQSATIIPFVSDLQVVNGRLAVIQENSYQGIERLRGSSEIRIKLHQHPTIFHYSSSQIEDYAYLQQTLSSGDGLTLWTAPAPLSEEYSIWQLQKDDEVLLSYDHIRDSSREQSYLLVGGLFFVWCGFYAMYRAQRAHTITTRNPYQI